MSLFPQSQINIDITKTADSKLGKSFLFDFSEGDFVLKDGKLIETDDIEALKIWITKILKTEKFKFKIYEKQDKNLEYGVTIKDLLFGQKYPRAFVLSELNREIRESLIKHTEIENVENFEIERNGTVAIISFKVNLKSKSSTEMEVRF